MKNIKDHKRIIFNGNGYDDSWVKEAKKRGLLNLRSTPEALQHTMDEKNVTLFEKYGVYSKVELASRNEIHYKNYSTIIHIEADTMIDMVKKQILDASSKYGKELSDTIIAKNAAESGIDVSYETVVLKEISSLTSDIWKKVCNLEKAVSEAESIAEADKAALCYGEKVFAGMQDLRESVDQLEVLMPKKEWPMPSYGDILFSVR